MDEETAARLDALDLAVASLLHAEFSHDDLAAFLEGIDSDLAFRGKIAPLRGGYHLSDRAIACHRRLYRMALDASEGRFLPR